MAQKVLVSRTRDLPGGDLVEAEVDQVVLVRSPAAALGEAVSAGLKKTGVEVAVAYDGHCVTSPGDLLVSPSGRRLASGETSGARSAMHGMLAHGVLVARAGVGFTAREGTMVFGLVAADFADKRGQSHHGGRERGRGAGDSSELRRGGTHQVAE